MGVLLFGKDETVEMIKKALEQGKLDDDLFFADFHYVVDHDCNILLASWGFKDRDLRHDAMVETFFAIHKGLVEFVEKSHLYNEAQRSGYLKRILRRKYWDALSKTDKNVILFEGEETEYKIGFDYGKNPGVHTDPSKKNNSELVEEERVRLHDMALRTIQAVCELPYGADKLMAYIYSKFICDEYQLREKNPDERKEGTSQTVSKLLNGRTLYDIRMDMELYLSDSFGHRRLNEELFAGLDKKLLKLDKNGNPYYTHRFDLTIKKVTDNLSKIHHDINLMWDEISCYDEYDSKKIS